MEIQFSKARPEAAMTISGKYTIQPASCFKTEYNSMQKSGQVLLCIAD